MAKVCTKSKVFVEKTLKLLGLAHLNNDNLTGNSKITINCQNCGKPRTSSIKELKNTWKNQKRIWCRACVTKYLAPTVKKKREETMLKRYGVENAAKSKELLEKKKQTCLKRYGAESPLGNIDIRNKSKKTWLENYGVENPGQRDCQKQKIKDYYKKNPSPSQVKFLERMPQSSIEQFEAELIAFLDANPNYAPCSKETAKRFNCSIDTISQVLQRYSRQDLLKKSGSTLESIVTKYITDNYSGLVIKQARNVIPPKEVDIYLPELKIAFEINGLWWHSEHFHDKTYHYDKWKACLDVGISLYTIWEHEWGNAWKILIKKLVSPKKPIYARKTSIITDKNIIRNFINQTHIQKAGSILEAVGLVFNKQIVAALTISQHHRKGSMQMVLNRVCFGEFYVIGGLSKMLKALKYRGDLITWSNNCYAPNPTLYENSGFKRIKNIPPDYFYVDKNGNYHSKQSQMRNKIQCSKDETEREFNLERGFWRVWDCGKIRWLKE